MCLRIWLSGNKLTSAGLQKVHLYIPLYVEDRISFSQPVLTDDDVVNVVACYSETRFCHRIHISNLPSMATIPRYNDLSYSLTVICLRNLCMGYKIDKPKVQLYQ
jgi:hypothetical protein